MGNSKNKKVTKKRNAFNSSKCKSSTDQKENVPKKEKKKVTKRDPNDSICMSKQLLQKKTTTRSTRRSSSKNENRICGNGKPIPSLAELEKMFEDSDDDQSPKTPQKTPTPTKQKPENNKNEIENKLLSPTTINKISERMLDLISNINPIELLEDVQPPPPIIPQKKRKKPEVPYIVGCKDRPQVIRKPTTNFCKGDDDYGVEALADPEEPPTKRAKKSRIPNYSKSIFNAQSDEIAERLTREDPGDLSDASSSDSNKTIQYDPTPFTSQRPHSFSPLPSTSRDNETFLKNDNLFNESLKEMIKDETIIEDTIKVEPTKGEIITEDITKDKTLNKTENDVQIIDIPYDTIVIDDSLDRGNLVNLKNTSNTIDLSVIEIVEPVVIDDTMQENIVKYRKHSDDDCILVPSSIESHNNTKQPNEPIVIDDEYSSINMEYTYDKDTIEIIDVDDVIAENKSILDKWKTSGTKENINTVVEVPTTYKNSTPQTNATPSVSQNLNMANEIIQNNHIQNTRDSYDSILMRGENTIEKIVGDFFKEKDNETRNKNNTTETCKHNSTSCLKSFFNAVVSAIQGPQAPVSNKMSINVHPNPHNNYTQPVSTPILHNAGNGPQNPLTSNLNQQTYTSFPVPPIIAGCRPQNPSMSDFNRQTYTSLPVPPRNARHMTQNPSISDLHWQTYTSLPLPPLNSGNRQQSPSAIDISRQTNNSLRIPPPNAGSRPQNPSMTDLRQKTNASLPVPSSPQPSRSIGDCPICMDPLSSNGIASTMCGHVFCLKCIQAAIKANGKRCPTCRKALKGAGGGYHQLYL